MMWLNGLPSRFLDVPFLLTSKVVVRPNLTWRRYVAPYQPCGLVHQIPRDNFVIAGENDRAKRKEYCGTGRKEVI